MKKRAVVSRWLIGSAAVAFGYLVYEYLTLPDVRPLASGNPSTTAFIELRAREALAQGKRPSRIQQWVSGDHISPILKRAVIITEDAAFWQHEGIDYEELRVSLELNLDEGQFVRGASTITQQLAKNLYLSPSRNPLRKIRELVIARRLEAELSKARIFELYLNVIEWGDGIYGAEAAARTYFQTSASSLGPSEAALLAGAIVNPRLLNPARPNARLLARQRLILGRMGESGLPVERPVPEPLGPSTIGGEVPVPRDLAPPLDAEPEVAPADPPAPDPSGPETIDPSSIDSDIPVELQGGR
jgi:monofunctional biosynthetic peptidoglycan transglycosylase